MPGGASKERRQVIPRRRYFGRVSREPQPRRNEEIRLSPLRVIDQNNKQAGVISREDALNMAREAGLDLVEIKADVRPPICKVMDYGKYKYEQSKKKSSSKSKQTKANEIKEIRLGRSIKIDKHDVAIRVQHARKFLIEGYKVMVVQRFRGREMAHPQLGYEQLKKVGEALQDIAKVTRDPVLSGRQMTMMVEPNKDKVAAWLKKNKKEAEALAATEVPDDDDVLDDEETSDDAETAAATPQADAEKTAAATPQADADKTADEEGTAEDPTTEASA